MIRFKNWLIKKLGGFTKLEVLKITETYEDRGGTILTREVVGKFTLGYSDIKGLSEGQVLYMMKREVIKSLTHELIPYINYEFLDKPWSMEKEVFAYIKIVEGK